ncbi:MAG: hypothetical protein QOH59_2634 [Gemmatimonadales bacterium]|nr:hypothetical protein [Gemmatimonadales bacterium]
MQRSRPAALGLLTVLALLPALVRAQEPALVHHSVPILGSITGEWLHAGGEALNRDASQSFALIFAHDRPSGLRFELGYLRAARAVTNAEGVTAGLSLPLQAGRLTVRPGFSMLLGAAEAGVDRGGYNWADSTGQIHTGYQGRPLDANGTALGAGFSLGAEVRLLAGISLAGSVRQWLFAGSVLRGDRATTLLGFGLAVHPTDVIRTLRRRPVIVAAPTSSPEGM